MKSLNREREQLAAFFTPWLPSPCVSALASLCAFSAVPSSVPCTLPVSSLPTLPAPLPFSLPISLACLTFPVTPCTFLRAAQRAAPFFRSPDPLNHASPKAGFCSPPFLPSIFFSLFFLPSFLCFFVLFFILFPGPWYLLCKAAVSFLLFFSPLFSKLPPRGLLHSLLCQMLSPKSSDFLGSLCLFFSRLCFPPAAKVACFPLYSPPDALLLFSFSF